MNQEQKKFVFISHAAIDNKGTKVVDRLEKILLDNEDAVFCTTDPRRGIFYGKELFKEINEKLDSTDYFVAIITDNYVRSVYCMYEMSVARYKGLTIIPIFANIKLKEKLKGLINNDIVSLDVESSVEENMPKSIQLQDLLQIKKEDEKAIAELLVDISKIKGRKPYIGMLQEEYDDINKYCEDEGIVKINKGYVYDRVTMWKKIESAQCVYIVATTGTSLLKSICEKVLPDALRNGVEVNVIIPDKESQFCRDVAMAECERYNTVVTEQNEKRIATEFDSVHQYLNEAYCHSMSGEVPPKGKIRCFNSRSLLRQTIFLAVSKDNSAWGWVTMTVPPLRTSDTPSFVIEDNDVRNGLGKVIVEHCRCLMQLAEKNNEVREISGDTRSIPFGSAQSRLEEYWKRKKETADRYMKEKQARSSGVLIEVASQHPLFEGDKPNAEFTNRLDFAIRLLSSIKANKVKIYVPGSRHSFNGKDDKISLSLAGKNYLISKGIDENIILAEEANEKYKGESGVYNSADECYVASEIFKDGDFGTLISVCSPNQVMRKTFNYIEFGVLPLCYGIPSSNMFHDVVSEYFNSLNETVFRDHSWQDETSEAFINSRKERRPSSDSQ